MSKSRCILKPRFDRNLTGKAALVTVSETVRQEYATVAVDLLAPHPNNPRKGSVSAIVESIGENGFYGAVVVQKSTGYILAGNHRWMAARESGLATVPVIYVDVDDGRAAKILLADNRTNDLAGYNNEALTELLADLSNTVGLGGTGYDESDLEALVAEMASGSGLAEAMGGLPDGDKPPFQQMTFTLHDSQAEQVRLALQKAKGLNSFEGSENENGNGNALAAVCEAYL